MCRFGASSLLSTSEFYEYVACVEFYWKVLLGCVQMLAPRKILWSTPPEVAEAAIDLLQPTTGDILYDIGAGDCRFLLQCLEITGAYCVGVEIDKDRAEEGRSNIAAAGFTDDRFTIITGNALDQVKSKNVAIPLLPKCCTIQISAFEHFTQKLGLLEGDSDIFVSCSKRSQANLDNSSEYSEKTSCRHVHVPVP